MPSAIPIFKSRRIADTVRFYTEVLGFSLDWGDTSNDPSYVSLSWHGAQIHVSSFPEGVAFGSWAYIFVDNVDELLRQFTGAGLEDARGPFDQTWGRRELHVQDPDGNGLCFGAPPGSGPR